MKTTNNKRKLIALLLSAMMLSSAGVTLASCDETGDTSSSTSSSTSTPDSTTDAKKDEGLIKNSNFDFTKLSDTTLIGSPSNWTVSSTNAATHLKTSGVVDVSDEAWNYLTKASKTEAELKQYETATEIPESVWETFNAKDKIAFYSLWKKANPKKTISKDFKNYEALNVSSEDKLPSSDAVSPKTHAEIKDSEGNVDTNVLMIHNSTKTNNVVGTAKKYTSSSTVTIPAGSSAQFSVWVKTADLMMSDSEGKPQPAVGKGAYITVSHSVGGKSLPAYEVKNINTEGVTENNGWVQYSFYIQGSSYASTTFSIALGLGQGGGDDQNDYVQGFAFFDDIQCEIITNKEFNDATKDLSSFAHIEDEKKDKTVDAFVDSSKTFAMDFNTHTWTPVNNAFTLDTKLTESTDGVDTNTKLGTEHNVVASFKDTDTTDDKNVFDLIAAHDADNAYLQSVYNNFLNKAEYAENNGLAFSDKETLLILSATGAAYTVNNGYQFSIPANEDYLALSFYVKTSDLDGGVGAGIFLLDENNESVSSFSAIDTTDLAGVKMGDDEDRYDGWQQVFFFVERAEDADISKAVNFSLRFTYGPTDINSTTAKTSFKQGFAAFTNFETLAMNEIEFDSAAAGTYAKKVVIGEKDEETTGNSGFDSAAAVPSNALEVGLAAPKNYKGVYSDSAYVTTDNTDRTVNTYANAGLLSEEHFAKVYEANKSTAWMTTLANNETDATKIWNNAFGSESSQPLVIFSDSAATKAYGFIGSSKSLANGYTAVSLRVKTNGATASVYLIDMDDNDRGILSVNKNLAYWYDENGNICDGDPSKSATLIAFNLQDNGLYTANDNWNGYTAAMNGQYYANLSAYTEGADGHLYAAEDSATHSYHGYDWDRIVFYKHSDGKYYTEKDGGLLVNDLLDLTKKCDYEDVEDYTGTEPLSCRYYHLDSNGKQITRELKIENINTNGKWMTVTFYLGKGDNAKNYRLEVWNGTRDGVKTTDKTVGTVNTSGWVAFDMNNPGTASENVTNLLTMHKENDYAGVDKFDNVFSYYDTDKHVRYDKDADTEKVGNLYTAPTKDAGVAYLSEATESGYTVIVDYSKSDVNVTATTPETEEEKPEDTTDDDSETNVWLLASSISVAAVLLLAVVSIVVRKLLEKAHKKHGFKVRKPKTKK